MTERAAPFDDATIKVGLLMEGAQAHQKMAEEQLDRLRAHTRELDGVVRDEIRRTLVEELRALTAEAARVTLSLRKLRAAGRLRGAAWSLASTILCTFSVAVAAHWVLPSPGEFATLRARRDELAANLAKLEQQGGRIDWRRCGDARRLCVRIDRKAPPYGDQADYLVIAGY